MWPVVAPRWGQAGRAAPPGRVGHRRCLICPSRTSPGVCMRVGGCCRVRVLLCCSQGVLKCHGRHSTNQTPKTKSRGARGARPPGFPNAQASDGDTGQSPNLDKIPHSPGHGFWLVRIGARVRTRSIGQLREGPEQSLGARIHDVRSLPRVRQHSPFATGHSPHANT